MRMITSEQRRALVEHAMSYNRSGGPGRGATEDGFADVIVDLAMDRPVADRDLFVRFLWRRVFVAVRAGISPKDHRVWSAAVTLLDQLGEDLEDIFTGRPREQLGARRRERS
jgi:hypothetical protein